jgi:hypothetical protein
MAVDPPTRVNYFDRQFIRLAELRDEQAYHIEMRRRHNLSHHSWGIVLGLQILPQDDGRPAVRPGMAVDGYGRELLLKDSRAISRSDFDRYGTSRLDVWLEYRLDFSDDRLAPIECDGNDPRRKYRATELAEITFTRGGARPDPHRPPGVPAEALEEPLLATPDDPRQRWPVYLGRVIMELPASGGSPTFTIDTADRVYAGLNAEIIDHPGNATRLELGHRPALPDVRRIDDEDVTYEEDPKRDFAVFVPPETDDGSPLHPTIAVDSDATLIRGTTIVHGNVVLDGASLEFPQGMQELVGDTAGQPAIYRMSNGGDELRIDVGSLDLAGRRLVLGVTKGSDFIPALTISFPQAMGQAGNPGALVTVHGDLRIEGTIDCPDVRTRTVTEDVAALLTGMVQAGIAAGGS